MFSVCRAAAVRLGLDDLLPCTDCGNPFPDHLLHQLEILACDSNSLAYRPCEVALALLTTYFQQRVAMEPSHSSALMGFVSELQKYCNVSSKLDNSKLSNFYDSFFISILINLWIQLYFFFILDLKRCFCQLLKYGYVDS